MQPRRASYFGGDRSHSGDANGSEGIHNVHGQGPGAIQQCANGVCASQQKPVKGAQIAKRFIQRSKVTWRMERDHRLKHGFGATRFQLANQRLGLIGCSSNENISACEGRR
jgi:hypothetical protein